jgi:ATP-dependent helicase HrpA
MTGVAVDTDLWLESELPPHLRFNIRLLDETGAALAESRDLDALRAEYGARARQQFTKATSERIARDGIVRWDFEDLPESIVAETGLVAHPALVDQGDHVAIRVYERPDEARAAHRGGAARLLRLALAEKLKSLRKQMPLPPKAAIAYTVIASPDQLRADVAEAALDDIAGASYEATRSRAAFEALVRDAGNRLAPRPSNASPRRSRAHRLRHAAAQAHAPLMGFAKANFDDLREQLKGLIHAGFARELTLERLREFPRYLKAMAIRAERLQQDPRKDQVRMLRVQEFVAAYEDMRHRDEVPRAKLDELRWAIEEFRVQEFAQELGVRGAVSEKRLHRMLAP